MVTDLLLSYLPIIFLFVTGFLISRLIPTIATSDLAEQVAVWFGLGLLVSISNTFILDIFGILYLLLPVSIIELAIFLSLLVFQHKLKISFSTQLTPTIVFLLILLVLCVILVSFRTVNFARNPDEYKYVVWAQNLLHGKMFVPGGLGVPSLDSTTDFWPWMQHYVYGLTLVDFFQIGDFSLFTGQLMSGVFYAMLVLASYLLGSLRNKKTGLICSVFLAFNPMIFLFSDHIMTDIPIAAFATLSLYFFIKAYDTISINKKYFFMALVFATFGLFTKGTGLFLLPLISIYAMNRQVLRSFRQLTLRLVPILFFFASFAGDATRFIFTHIPSSSYQVFIEPLHVFSWSSVQWSTYFFASPTGAFGTFIFPYFYTFGVALLILLGLATILAKERNKIDLLFFTTLVMILWVFTTSSVIGGTVRNIFVVYPILMYFAAIGIQLRKLKILVIPFCSLLLFIPTHGYVPYVQNTVLPTSFTNFILITGLMTGGLILFDFFLEKQKFKISIPCARVKKKLCLSFSLSGLLTVILLLLTVVVSIYSGLYYMSNAPLEVNENSSISSLGFTQAVSWFNTNVPQNARIASNNPYVFPFYLSMISKNYSIVNLPLALNTNVSDQNTNDAFINFINSDSIDYLVLFYQLGYSQFYPYLHTYLTQAPSGMYEVNQTTNYVIYKTYSNFGQVGWEANFSHSWAYGWSQDSRSKYQMENSSGVSSTNNRLNFYGVSTLGQDKTQWSHWLAVSTGNLSIDLDKYPYLYLSYNTGSLKTELQLGFVINGSVFVPMQLSSVEPNTYLVNLRDLTTSGNVTEIFVRCRLLNSNMTMNSYIYSILFTSSVS